MLAAIPTTARVAFRGLDNAHLHRPHPGLLQRRHRGRQRRHRHQRAADVAGRSCADDVAAGRRAAWTRSWRRSAGAPSAARWTRTRSTAMRDVAMGTSPAPANARRGDPQRGRDAADVAALREPPGARRARRSRARNDYLALDRLRDRVAALVHVLADAARRRAAGRRRRRLAGDRRRLRRAARPRVRRSAHARHRSGSSGTSGCASSRSPASPPSAPRSRRWRRASSWASPATTTGATWCARCATSPTSTPGRSAGTFADLHDVRPSRSRARPTSRASTACRPGAAAATTRASPTAAARGPPAARRRCWSSSLEQTNPFHRGAFIRRAILCDTLPQPDPNSLPPGSLDPPPPSTAMTTRQRFAAKVEGNGLCQACHASFSNLGYVDGVVRRARPLPHDGEGVRRADRRAAGDAAASTRSAVAAGDRRRPAAGERPGRAEPAHPRERQGRGLPVARTTSATRCAAIRPRDSADACAYEAMRSSLARRAARWPTRSASIAAEHELPPAQGGCAMNATDRTGQGRTAARRMFLQGRGRRGARAAVPRVAAAAARPPARPRRRPSGSSCSSRSARSWSRSGTRASPATATSCKDSKYSGSSKADGTTLLTQKLVSGKNYTWAPLADFQTATGISGILGPALNPFLSKLTLIRGLDFLPVGEPQLRRPARQLLVVHGGHAVRRRQHRRRADHRSGDGVFAQGLPDARPGLRYLHISQGVDRLDVVFGPRA